MTSFNQASLVFGLVHTAGRVMRMTGPRAIFGAKWKLQVDKREQHVVITSFGNYTSPQTLLLTPWSRVLHEKLTGSKIVKKFPTFYGIRLFVIVLTIARHLSIS